MVENKRGGRDRHSFWTLLKNDVHLRTMCRAFVKHHEMSLRKISKEIGVYPYQLSNYLNNKDNTKLSDLQILRLADFLGFKVKIKVELKEDAIEGGRIKKKSGEE